MKVLSNFVLVEMIERDKVTSGGIYLPDSGNNESVRRGVVRGIGAGLMTVNGIEIPMSVGVGDVVLFNGMGAKEVVVGGCKHLVVRENDIYLVE